jgi:nucleotide-binding universal stress UspA family protein
MRATSLRAVTRVTASEERSDQDALKRTKSMKTATARTAVGFRNILFATDFSSAAAHAVPYVKRIAKHYDANLVALHVRPPVVTEPAYWPTEVTIRKENEELRGQLLDTFAGIRTTPLIEEGDIQSRLQEAIAKNNTDLVVIGTRGRTGLGKMLLGSTAEEIFRTVTCPVLTVGPHADTSLRADGEIREILYATDLASPSPAAAAYAVSLAQEFQARLILLHVIAEPKVGELVSAHDVTQAGKDLLRKLVPAEAEAWCKPEFFVERGNPADRILEFAHLRESRLIVLGVKPEGGVPGAATHLPNATAHKVVSYAECPVLTVRS